MADDQGGGSTGGSAPPAMGMNAQGKYFHLEVPDFADGMTSYLHLGAVQDLSQAANPSAPQGTGEDLAAMITSFIDDARVRDGCPNFVPEGTRHPPPAPMAARPPAALAERAPTTSPCARRSTASRCTPRRRRGRSTSPDARRCSVTCSALRSRRNGSSHAPTGSCASR